MKNKFTKLVSSVLVIALLISAFAVLVSANGTETADDSSSADKKDVTLLINRTFDEGWDATNGFTNKINGNSYDVEYEEAEDFSYNYYTRIEALNKEESYLEAVYGDNKPKEDTVFEFDIRLDDFTHFDTGTLLYALSSSTKMSFLGIKNNVLYLPGAGKIATNASPSTAIGNIMNDKWLHVAFAFNFNNALCPVCGEVVDIPDGTPTTDKICCTDDPNSVALDSMTKVLVLRVYYGYQDAFDAAKAVEGPSGDLDGIYYYDTAIQGITSIDSFRIGLPGAKSVLGASYLVDNIRLYNNAPVPVAKDAFDTYGENVDVSQAKSVEIKTGGGDKTVIQYIDEGLVMKLGSDYCLSAGEAILLENGAEDNLYSGPAVKIDCTVYVPLQAILDWMGYPMYAHEDGKSFDISTANGATFVTIGRNTATSNGQLITLTAPPVTVTEENFGRDYICIALSDVEKLFTGYYATYDEMGLIAISTGKNLFNRESDLTLMIDTMKRFIYKQSTSDDYYYNLVKENTNNFDHPYLVANEDDFARLKNVYSDPNADPNLKGYIDSILKESAAVYAEYAVSDPSVNGGYLLDRENGKLLNPLADEENHGYAAISGRLDEIVQYANELRLLAFGYRILGDVRYARLAYEIAHSLTEWTHWGPAYFLNTADAVAAYAIAYDWLYDVWTGEDAKNDYWEDAPLTEVCGIRISDIEDAIYKHGISQGWRSSNNLGLEDDFKRNQPEEFTYTTMSNSWNAVCTSGMVIGALALIGGEDYKTNSEWIINNNTRTLITYGLEAYAPDGSYGESPYNWAYATNALALMSWCLETATGDDLGFMNTWGVDRTFYFACQIEFPSVATPDGYQVWNYNESPLTSQNTSFFYYAADALNDDALAAIRLSQLERKTVSIWDVFGYNSAYATLDMSNVDLSLDAKYENCEGVSSRSDWEDGALYVGIMGNQNNSYHGQIDSGNFIYANKNFTWFADMGGENNSVYEAYNNEYRYCYYKNSGEGANVVIVEGEGNIPYGQELGGGGKIIEYATEDAGMYTIIDNKSAYASIEPISAYRGVLLTNNRKTVVIQDEINFGVSNRSICWIGHTAARIDIQEGGRTALLFQKIDGEQYVLRASIISNNKSFVFSTRTTYETILNQTHDKIFSTKQGGAPEDDRSQYSRLIIEGNAATFKLAVVLEMIGGYSEEDIAAPVEYNYTELAQWRPSDENAPSNVINESYAKAEKNESVIGNLDVTMFDENAKLAYNYVRDDYAFNEKFIDFYRSLAYCALFEKEEGPYGAFDKDSVNFVGREVYKQYDYYVDYKAQYDNFRADINSQVNYINTVAKNITGAND